PGSHFSFLPFHPHACAAIASNAFHPYKLPVIVVIAKVPVGYRLFAFEIIAKNNRAGRVCTGKANLGAGNQEIQQYYSCDKNSPHHTRSIDFDKYVFYPPAFKEIS